MNEQEDKNPDSKNEVPQMEKPESQISPEKTAVIPSAVPSTSQGPPRPGLSFTIGSKLEAKDFTEKWYSATIVETDERNEEVLIHFDKWSSRYDEWIAVDSPRLRALQTPSREKKKQFRTDEKVLATWGDGRKYPASIKTVLDNDMYDVLFDDGFSKILKSSKLSKYSHRSPAAVLPGPSHNYDSLPVSNYSKQDRRDKKRKFNVAELALMYGKKKCRTSDHKKQGEFAENQLQLKEGYEIQSDTNSSRETFSNDELSPIIRTQFKKSKKQFDPVPQWLEKKYNENELYVHEEDTATGSKRSLIMQDKKLPDGWQKHIVQRKTGTSAGKWDVLFMHAASGKKFRSRNDIRAFMENQGQLDFDPNTFDFCVQPNKNRLQKPKLDEPMKKIKTLLPKVKPGIFGEPSTSNELGPINASSSMPISDQLYSDNATFIGDLRVEIKDSAYKCPIEGCNKVVRNENLLQMHIKHYHPKYSRLLGSTPNVADLAYARTVGEPIGDILPKKSKLISASHTIQSFQGVIPSISLPNEIDSSQLEVKDSSYTFDKSDRNAENSDNNLSIEDSTDRISSCTMSPGTLFDLRQSEDKIHTGIKTLLPMRPGSSSDIDPIAYYEPSTKVKKQKPIESEQEYDNTEDTLSYDDTSDFSYKYNSSKTDLLNESSQSKDEDTIILENGEVIKVEKLRKEEIINCTCNITEEDGLMIQCDLCLCWQHGHCRGIEKESDVPDKYICTICLNPFRQRPSKKYKYDQEWITEGKLPTLDPNRNSLEKTIRKAKLKRSFELSGSLLEIQQVLHSLKVKINVAMAKDHPKLYLWAKDWKKPEIPVLDMTPVPILEIHKNKNEESNVDNENSVFSIIKEENEEKLITSDTELMKILEEDSNIEKPKSPGNNAPKSDQNLINQVSENIQSTSNHHNPDQNSKDSARKSPSPGQSNMQKSIPGASHKPQANDNPSIIHSTIPEPEAPIDPKECKLRLLNHIEHYENYLENMLNYLEVQVDSLEKMDNSEDLQKVNSDVVWPETLTMLLNDLNTVRKMASLCSN